MKCGWCSKEVKDGLIQDGIPFCDKEHAEENRRYLADFYAEREGFRNFEDMADHYGWLVLG